MIKNREFPESEVLGDNITAVDGLMTNAVGPAGALPLTEEMLRDWPSGDIFGLTQNAGMGWTRTEMLGPQFLSSSARRAAFAPTMARRSRWAITPAIGKSGCWCRRRRDELKPPAACRLPPIAPILAMVARKGRPACSTACPYRNDAAIVFRRLIRSLPTRRGVLGVATCDKGLPAMMLALAGMRELPCVLVPGGVTLPADRRRRRRQGAIHRGPLRPSAKFTLEEAAELGCRACASPGGGCQFLGTAATSRSSARRWACPCRTRRWRHRASRSGSTWPAAARCALSESARSAASRYATF